MTTNIQIAEAYYSNILKGQKKEIPTFYHPDIEFITPLSELQGISSVAKAASGFSDAIQELKFRAKFENIDRVMMACDVLFKGSSELLKTAILMDFENEKIRRIECFYDGSKVLEAEKKQIFS